MLGTNALGAACLRPPALSPTIRYPYTIVFIAMDSVSILPSHVACAADRQTVTKKNETKTRTCDFEPDVTAAASHKHTTSPPHTICHSTLTSAIPDAPRPPSVTLSPYQSLNPFSHVGYPILRPPVEYQHFRSPTDTLS